jgi:hypothetical protein
MEDALSGITSADQLYAYLIGQTSWLVSCWRTSVSCPSRIQVDADARELGRAHNAHTTLRAYISSWCAFNVSEASQTPVLVITSTSLDVAALCHGASRVRVLHSGSPESKHFLAHMPDTRIERARPLSNSLSAVGALRAAEVRGEGERGGHNRKVFWRSSSSAHMSAV